jgi:hypothetical protein
MISFSGIIYFEKSFLILHRKYKFIEESQTFCVMYEVRTIDPRPQWTGADHVPESSEGGAGAEGRKVEVFRLEILLLRLVEERFQLVPRTKPFSDLKIVFFNWDAREIHATMFWQEDHQNKQDNIHFIWGLSTRIIFVSYTKFGRTTVFFVSCKWAFDAEANCWQRIRFLKMAEALIFGRTCKVNFFTSGEDRRGYTNRRSSTLGQVDPLGAS